MSTDVVTADAGLLRAMITANVSAAEAPADGAVTRHHNGSLRGIDVWLAAGSNAALLAAAGFHTTPHGTVTTAGDVTRARGVGRTRVTTGDVTPGGATVAGRAVPRPSAARAVSEVGGRARPARRRRRRGRALGPPARQPATVTRISPSETTSTISVPGGAVTIIARSGVRVVLS